MNRVFHFILSHSIFISLCAAALSLQTLQLLSLPVNSFLLAFIFFATLFAYNAYWVVSRYSYNRHIPFNSFLKKCVSSILVMFIAMVGLLYCMGKLHLVMYNIMLTFVLFCVYVMPVLPFKRLHFTRKAGYLKTVLLAISWTVVTILIPLQIPFFKMGADALLLFINRFLLMLLLCIIFDKRDAAIDKMRGLQSLATNINPRLLHYLMGFIFTAYILVSYSMQSYGVSMPEVAALILTGLVTLFVYISSLKKKGYLFYYFLVDGMMFLSALLTGLAGLFRV